MLLYKKLKEIYWINYYILGPYNNSWYETFRNPFFGIGQVLGTKNIKAHSIIDLRIGYYPYNYDIEGSKITMGNYLVRWKIKKLILFELRKSHPIDGCYYNGFLTFSFNLTNKYFPWVSFNFRPFKNYMFNFGAGWKGTNSLDNEIARFGLKCRITSHKKACKYNPGVVSPNWYEGHI